MKICQNCKKLPQSEFQSQNHSNIDLNSHSHSSILESGSVLGSRPKIQELKNDSKLFL